MFFCWFPSILFTTSVPHWLGPWTFSSSDYVCTQYFVILFSSETSAGPQSQNKAVSISWALWRVLHFFWGVQHLQNVSLLHSRSDTKRKTIQAFRFFIFKHSYNFFCFTLMQISDTCIQSLHLIQINGSDCSSAKMWKPMYILSLNCIRAILAVQLHHVHT